MEKNSVVTTPRGYQIKVADHMLSDLAKFGATKNNLVKRPVPKELKEPIKIIKAVELNSPADLTPNLPEMKVDNPPVVEQKEEPVIKTRKAPVRSRAKK